MKGILKLIKRGILGNEGNLSIGLYLIYWHLRTEWIFSLVFKKLSCPDVRMPVGRQSY